MVTVNVPSEHWEIEFGIDGAVEVEVYRSDGNVCGVEAIESLFTEFGGAG